MYQCEPVSAMCPSDHMLQAMAVASGFDVADALLRVAEIGEDTEGAGPASRSDVLAMATHGRSGIARWTLGSVTERVLHGTKLPLLIVRPVAVAEQTGKAVV